MNEHLFNNIEKELLEKISLKYGMNYHDTFDIFQQFLLIAWEKRKDLTQENWHNYISRTIEVIYNKKLKHYKKFCNNIEEIEANQSYSPDYFIILQEFNKKANQIISELNPIQKKTLEYKLLNKSIKQIAKKTNTNKGTVMSRLYTIRQKLKNELSDYIDAFR